MSSSSQPLVRLRHLVKDSVIYAFGRGGTQVVAFLLLPIYTRHLEVYDFAFIELINVISNFCVAFVGFNIISGVARYHYDYSEIDEVKVRNITAFLFTLLSTGCFIIFLMLFDDKIRQFSNLEQTSHYIYVIFLFPVTYLNQYILFQFQIQKKSKQFSLFNILTIVFVSIPSIYLVVFLEQGIDGYMTGRILGLGCVSLIGMAFVWNDFREWPSWKELKRMLKFALPSLPGQLFQKAKVLIERQVIILFIGTTMLGNYAITIKLLLPIGLLLESFRLSWVAFVSSTITQDNNKELYSRSLEGFVLVMVLMAIPLAIMAKELILIFAGDKFSLAYQPFSWLLFNTLLGSLVFLNVGLGIAEKMQYMSYGTILSGSITIVFYYALTPYLQLWGLLLSQTIGIVIFLSFTYYYSNRFFKIDFSFLKPALLGGLYILVSIGIHFFDKEMLPMLSAIGIKIMIIAMTFGIIWLVYKNEMSLLQKHLRNYFHIVPS